MNIREILNGLQKPDIYSPGSHIMWTDEYISKQLLQAHLDTNADLASRKDSTILKTSKWILSQADVPKGCSLDILDLGCGPGLYTEQLAAAGHRLTGVDFSEGSIAYARKQTKEAGTGISYRHENYLEIELPEHSYDLVIMIFTDFGVLTPKERVILLDKVKRCLKPDGLFIFDVLNDRNWLEKAASPSWECSSGFWSPEPYLALSDSVIYEDDKVILNNHIIACECGEIQTYHFWIRFFSDKDLSGLLVDNGFRVRSFHTDVLPEDGPWNGNNVTFAVAGL